MSATVLEKFGAGFPASCEKAGAARRREARAMIVLVIGGILGIEGMRARNDFFTGNLSCSAALREIVPDGRDGLTQSREVAERLMDYG